VEHSRAYNSSYELRSLDLALCDAYELQGRKIGTYFVWHLLNGFALFLLLRASFEVGVARYAHKLQTVRDLPC
jgi:hypothetical protein